MIYCNVNMPYVDINMCDEGARSEKQLILVSSEAVRRSLKRHGQWPIMQLAGLCVLA